MFYCSCSFCVMFFCFCDGFGLVRGNFGGYLLVVINFVCGCVVVEEGVVDDFGFVWV